MTSLVPAVSENRLRRAPDAQFEQRASDFLAFAREQRQSSRLWFLRHPVHAARGLRTLRRLPELRFESTGGPEAGAVRRGLLRGAFVRRAMLCGVTAVLHLPDEASAHLLGASKQTLRRKIRVAQKLGVTWRAVNDRAERDMLLQQLDESERTHVRAAYRSADPRNEDLLEIDQWLIATAADGRAVLLSVTPVDGQWAVLRTFRILEDSDESSAARYLMSQVLVEHLVARGVRHLADTQSPASLPPGLRFFQRVIGYRLVRVFLSGS